MILLFVFGCFVTTVICVTAAACSRTRLQHKFKMAQLKAAQERLLLGVGDDSSVPHLRLIEDKDQ